MTTPNSLLPKAALVAIASLLAGCGGSQTSPYPWMSPEVQTAWDSGYKGQGATITVVDGYSGDVSTGNLNGTTLEQTHGQWTLSQAQLVAPDASVRGVDYIDSRNTGYTLARGLNVINNSYGEFYAPGTGYFSLNNLARTTVNHAYNGTAVVVKSAGNDNVPIGAPVTDPFDQFYGRRDTFGNELAGAPSAILVGALDKNGTPTDRAYITDYSNFPGNSQTAQSNFLMVGVEEEKTNLSGTSFAAPIVSGYAAIVGSKFTTATPTRIAKQLLNTARTDTIEGYTPFLHGRGEASLSRALAPNSLQ